MDRVSWQSGRGDLELRAAGGPGRGQQIVTDEEIWELSLSFQPHCGEEAERTSGRGNTLCKRLELLWGDLRRLSACLVAQTVKVLPAVQDSWFQSLGLGRSPGEGNGYPLQYSCLETSVDRGAWRATVCGGHKELDMTERLTLVLLPARVSAHASQYPLILTESPWLLVCETDGVRIRNDQS